MSKNIILFFLLVCPIAHSKIKFRSLILSLSFFPFIFFGGTTYVNNHGTSGIINTPSADLMPEGFVATTFYRGNPDRKITLTFAPYDWLEGSIFYTSIEGKEYGGGFDQDYKDKGFNVKARLFKQNNLIPQLAVGLNDIGGTGYYSSEYIVGKYAINPQLDLNFGLGWGTLSGSGHIKNPFSYINSSFSKRKAYEGKGGELNFGRFLRGSTADFFGGLTYKYNSKTTFMLEHDPTLVPGLMNYPQAKSRLNFGINQITDYGSFSLNYERGNSISFNYTYAQDFSKKGRKFNRPKKLDYIDREKNLKKILNLNSIGLKTIEETKEKIHLDIREISYHDKTKFEYIVNEATKLSLDGFKDVEVTVWKAGLMVNKFVIKKKKNKIKKEKDMIFYSENPFPIINTNNSLSVRPFIAGREDFLKLALLLQNDTQVIFSENLFLTTNVKQSLIDNFSDLRYPPVNTFPEQVRSDIKEYLNNFNKGPFIGRAQIDFFKTIDLKHHVQLSAGIFEEMFSGAGFEYLWSEPGSKYSIGFESYFVKKREYDMRFRHQNYSNITSHLNLYYQNDYLVPFDIHLSVGEYLAGDRGYTFDLSRRLKNGTKYGLFFTRTNVSKLDFGEGSFDKGIYFSAPLFSKNLLSDIFWRPLTKDPGQKLIRMNNINEFLRVHR